MWLEEIFKGGAEGIFKGVADVVSKFVTDPTEKAKIEAELAKLQVTHVEQMEQMALSDRQSARQREMAVKDWTPSILAWTVILFWGAGNYYIFTHPLPVGSETLVARVLGTVDMAVGLILGYYYGSSAGSASKTETINTLIGK